MSDNEMLYCLIAFILGYFLCKQMGNGFSVGVHEVHHVCDDLSEIKRCDEISWDDYKMAGNTCHNYYSIHNSPEGAMGKICETRMMMDWGGNLDSTGEDSLQAFTHPCKEGLDLCSIKDPPGK